MPIWVKQGGVWRLASSVNTKSGGVWRIADAVNIKHGGAWREVHSASGNFDYIIDITSNASDVNILDEVIAAGWDQASDVSVQVNISSGVIVRSTVHNLTHTWTAYSAGAYARHTTPSVYTTHTDRNVSPQASAPAMRTGNFPGSYLQSLEINNDGSIIGPGGQGGAGDWSNKGVVNAGLPPGSGGVGLLVEDTCTINNGATGLIAGGGDGGDGGAGSSTDNYTGGGGGGAGYGPGGFCPGTGISGPHLWYATDAGATTAGTGEPSQTVYSILISGNPSITKDVDLAGSNGGALGDGAAIYGVSNATVSNSGTITGGQIS